MRKKAILIMICSGTVLFYSCNENLNPYGEFKDQYVLSCVVRADTSFQVAYLTKNYVTQDFNAYSNTVDPAIKNATIRIWNGDDTVAIMRDTSIARPAGSSYQTPYSAYYTKNFKPSPNSVISIEALLPNGKRLTSTSTVPSSIRFDAANTDTLVPPANKSYFKYAWNTYQKNPVFITRVGIYYLKDENNQKVRHDYIVPLSYTDFNGTRQPVYPSPISTTGYSVDMGVMNTAMKMLSDGDSNKSGYQILACIIEVLSLDVNLSVYYNATARGTDIYSVKLDETDYSNISGGLGMFGIYIKNQHAIRISSDYIRSFGYTPALQ